MTFTVCQSMTSAQVWQNKREATIYDELPKLKTGDWDGWYHHTTYACALCGAEQKEWWVNKGDNLQPDCWSFPLMSKVFKEHYLESHPESIKIHGRPGSDWVEYLDGVGYTRIE